MTVQESDEEFLHAMAVGEEFLEHHGVKGMKWGVRKSRVASAAGTAGRGAKTAGRGIKKAAVGTAKVADNVHFHLSSNTEATIHHLVSKASKDFKKQDLPRINAKPEYANARKLPNRLRHPGDPIVKQYRQEHKDAYLKQLDHAAKTMGNFQGNKHYVIVNDKTGKQGNTSKYNWHVEVRKGKPLKHADGSTELPDHAFDVEVHLDGDGFITGLGNPVLSAGGPGGSMAQSAMAPATSAPKTLKVNVSDHEVTKKVKQDHNNLSDEAFKTKYKVSKKAYQMRVGQAPNGDPFVAAQKK